MKKRIGRVILAGQPQLESVLNRICDAINAIEVPAITAGPGIAIRQDGARYNVATAQDRQAITQGLYPYLVTDGEYKVVGLTPGWVVFLENGGTSAQTVPYIGTDLDTGTLIDADPPPGIDKTPGVYYTRLTLESPASVKVEFVPVEDAPEADDDYLVINKFELVENAGKRFLQVLEVYLEQPLIPPRDDTYFAMTLASGVVVAEEVESVTVAVAAGVVLAHDVNIPQNDATAPDAPQIEEIPIDPDTLVGIEDGGTIWLKLHYITGTYAVSHTDDSEARFIYDDSYGVRVSFVHEHYRPFGNAESHEYIVVAEGDADPVGDREYGYIKMATVRIAGGRAHIEQYHRGLITAPTGSRITDLSVEFRNNLD